MVYPKELRLFHAKHVVIERYEIKKEVLEVVFERTIDTKLFKFLLAEMAFARHEYDVELHNLVLHVVLSILITYVFVKHPVAVQRKKVYKIDMLDKLTNYEYCRL